MKAHWRKASWFAAAFSLFAGLAPTVAQAAAPAIHSVEIYGNKRQSDCAFGNPAPTQTQIDACVADPKFGPSTLFANSQPRARYQKGLLWITGNADAGAIVDVTVTDAVDANGNAIGRTARESYMTAAQDVPEFGITEGDFVEAGDVPSLNVTDLGNHWAGTNGACAGGATAPGCDPASQDPADWGASTLYVIVKARNPQTGETSAAWTVNSLLPTITKYAGTPVPGGETGDKFAPSTIKGPTWPPAHWCHLSSRGTRVSMGGDYNGDCGSFQGGSLGALPDLTWLVFGCYPPEQFPNPWPTEWRSNACTDGTNSRAPTGEVTLSATISDDPSSAFGVASEIADAELEVLLGSTRVRGPYHPIVRNGPQAGYSQKLRINDFEPNYAGPTTTPYTASVKIHDAWGNVVSASRNFTVYPW